MKKKPEVYNCYLCGDKGSVYRAFIDPNCGLERARNLVPCPRCSPQSALSIKDKGYVLPGR